MPSTEGAVAKDGAGVARKRVVIPYVLPWESRPTVQNQQGMNAFGTGRNVFTRVQLGQKELPRDAALKSESVVPRLHDNVDLATQVRFKRDVLPDVSIPHGFHYRRACASAASGTTCQRRQVAAV